MLDNNYYEWLELPVETCVENREELLSIVESRIQAWNASKNQHLMDRAALYAEDLRRAVCDTRRWKKIYCDYALAVEGEIMQLMELGADEGQIADEMILNITKEQKVSSDYVKKIAQTKGYKIISAEPSDEFRITIDSIAPEKTAAIMLCSIQHCIEELSMPDIAALIRKEENTSVTLENSSKDIVVESLNAIKNKWRRVSASSSKYQWKSHYEKICNGMISFLKKYELENYVNYIKWRNAREVLLNLTQKLEVVNKTSITQGVFVKTLDDITAVIGNRNEAESILKSYCKENGIGYPQMTVKKEEQQGDEDSCVFPQESHQSMKEAGYGRPDTLKDKKKEKFLLLLKKENSYQIRTINRRELCEKDLVNIKLYKASWVCIGNLINQDYKINYGKISLTMSGMEKVERFFHIDDLTDNENKDIHRAILALLYAKHILKKEKDYCIAAGKVYVEKSKELYFENGLHQAIELKEGVGIDNYEVVGSIICRKLRWVDGDIREKMHVCGMYFDERDKDKYCYKNRIRVIEKDYKFNINEKSIAYVTLFFQLSKNNLLITNQRLLNRFSKYIQEIYIKDIMDITYEDFKGGSTFLILKDKDNNIVRMPTGFDNRTTEEFIKIIKFICELINKYPSIYEEVKNSPKGATEKIYPNDPCPCGSGMKYKQCCGRG